MRMTNDEGHIENHKGRGLENYLVEEANLKGRVIWNVKKKEVRRASLSL